jgi:predicted lipase
VDVSVTVGIFGKWNGAIKSITFAFHANPSIWDNLDHHYSELEGGGEAHSGMRKMYLAIAPALQEYHEVIRSMPKGFPMTFIGHREGGSIATFAAVDFAEMYPTHNVTLLTINTSYTWYFSYQERIDRAISNVYRWIDGYDIFPTTGHDTLHHEAWFVKGKLKCCPYPETSSCKTGRGTLDTGKWFHPTTFSGLDVAGEPFCKRILSQEQLPSFNFNPKQLE